MTHAAVLLTPLAPNLISNCEEPTDQCAGETRDAAPPQPPSNSKPRKIQPAPTLSQLQTVHVHQGTMLRIVSGHQPTHKLPRTLPTTQLQTSVGHARTTPVPATALVLFALQRTKDL